MLSVVNTVLNKVFVREFFRLNTGFFLVVLGLAFGFMSGIEHVALAQFFMSTPQTACIPLLLWLLYAWKIVVFNRQVLKKRGNEFLFHFSLVSATTQWKAVVQVFVVQISPAIAYGIFLGATALRIHQVSALLVVVSGIIVLCLAGTAILLYAMSHPDDERKVTRLKSVMDQYFVKRYPQFFLGWIARRSFALLAGTKLFSCVLIVTTIFLYSEEYDWRLLGMGLTVAFVSQIVLIFHYHRFENFHFQLLRSLPLSPERRLINFLLTMLIMALPEFACLTGKFPLHLGVVSWVTSVLYGMSIWVLLYGFLYRADIDMERLIQRVFAFALCYIVMILFGVPPLILVAVNCVTGWWLLRKFYYSFEFIASMESEK